MRKFLGLLLVTALLLGVPATAFASVGVGVGTGRIAISEKLKAGGIYTLPPITVYNTGTETATYSMSVTLNETQPQHKPDPAWFSFSPAQFELKPASSHSVTPIIHLPTKMPPGDYFGYLEAHPKETAQQGSAVIGVAAATKLSFSVTPSNILMATLYHLYSLYRQYEPWSHILAALILLALVIFLARRYLKVNIQVTHARKAKKPPEGVNKDK